MKNAKPANMPWVSCHLTVSDIEKSLQFYKSAFGFKIDEKEQHKDEKGNLMHAQVMYKDAVIMIGKEGSHTLDPKIKTPKNNKIESPVSIYLYCEDVDKLFAQAKQAKATVVLEPQEMFWGDRMCSLKDLDGYKFSFATNKE